jgi:hypothetical protein
MRFRADYEHEKYDKPRTDIAFQHESRMLLENTISDEAVMTKIARKPLSLRPVKTSEGYV